MTLTPEPTMESRGSIEYLDPATLVIEANIRFAPEMDKDDKELVESIKQVGVLEPVVARRDDTGTVLVRMGQRRTIAAREAGAATIPVFVTDAADDTARRIIEQLAENDHRKALTGAEHVAAFQQLAFEGLSVASIAKQTRHSSKSVKDALAVAENEGASEAIAKHDLTLDQAAALIEFYVMWTRERSWRRFAGLGGCVGCGLKLSGMVELSAVLRWSTATDFPLGRPAGSWATFLTRVQARTPRWRMAMT